MRTALYPGTFAPWHEGHQDVLNKTLMAFDRVILARGINPDKTVHLIWHTDLNDMFKDNPNVDVLEYSNFLHEAAKDFKVDAIIRGIRTGNDLDYERIQQYNLEDLGLDVPIFYLITDRDLSHISSSTIRMIKDFKRATR